MNLETDRTPEMIILASELGLAGLTDKEVDAFIGTAILAGQIVSLPGLSSMNKTECVSHIIAIQNTLAAQPTMRCTNPKVPS